MKYTVFNENLQETSRFHGKLIVTDNFSIWSRTSCAVSTATQQHSQCDHTKAEYCIN